MAHVYQNSYALDVGTSFVELYAASGEGLYAIITGMTISNKKLNEVLVDVRIVDSTNVVTAYLIADSKLSPGSTLALAGDIQNLVLKDGDSIEVACNETAALDVTLSIMENDPSVSYGGAGPDYLPWQGDKAMVTCGDTNINNVSTYIFTSQATTANIGNLSYVIEQSNGASNQVTALVLGGYYNSGQRTDTQQFTFSSEAWSYTWSYLGNDLRLGGSCSNGTNWMYMGGYDGSAEYTARHGDFASGTTASYWGSTATAYFAGGVGNSVYAIKLGGYGNDDYMQYFTWATQSNYSTWGNLVYSSYYENSGAGNETRALIFQGESYNTLVQYIEFATQGNSASWGTLSQSNGSPGAVSDDTEVLFTCGENGYSELASLETGGTTTQISGLADFSGQQPVSESGM